MDEEADDAAVEQEDALMRSQSAQAPDDEPAESHSRIEASLSSRRKSFLTSVVKTNGPPQIILLIFLFGLGFGSTIGVVSSMLLCALSL